MEPKHRFVHANGLRHHVVEQGSGPLVVFVHGFPESWYTWRHQLAAVARAGWRGVAIDVRGYGQTDAPADVAAYAMREHVADVAGIIEALAVSSAVVVGHDWGAHIAWLSAILRPDLVRAVAALSIPLLPASPAPPIELLRQRFADKFHYMVYFQEPGVAERELEADVRRSLRLVMHDASGEGAPARGFWGKPLGSGLLDGMVDPPSLPPWLTDADLDFYTGEFTRTGMRGGLNRYRNMDRDWHEHHGTKLLVSQPALFVAGDRDMSLLSRGPDAVSTMRTCVPGLRDAVILPGAGHWIGEERPAETNAALLKFLGGIGG